MKMKEHYEYNIFSLCYNSSIYPISFFVPVIIIFIVEIVEKSEQKGSGPESDAYFSECYPLNLRLHQSKFTVNEANATV